MKILHITATMDPATGGVSQAVRTIMEGLSQENIQSTVISLDAPESPFLSNENFLALGPGQSPWKYSARLLPWLKAHLDYYDVAIVHGLWQYHTYAAYAAWHSLKNKGVKLFVMPHGMLDPYFQRAKGRKIKALRNWVFWKLIENRLINQADGLLFTCETEKLLAQTTFQPYAPVKEQVSGLGVKQPPLFNSLMKETFLKKCPQLRNQPYLLFISRVHEKKGVDVLIKAYTQVKSREPRFPKLVIAGPGLETPFGQRVQDLANHDPDIIFTGMLSGQAKWGAFYGCEAFVLPSHQENFGIAVIEAMACGKPVLISDQVNIWREIVSGGGGMICLDTQAGVQEMLSQWAQLSGSQKQQMNEGSRTTYHREFSVQQTTQKMMALLH
ncbi:glycosyl transferase family 1 [Siphonobacter sp. BAB-5385]|uniref:glycosyltransferase n=1 Tax=Siphonobacter sp. BAB-5385 TaxID=1864822 RepID=UPI000B9E3C85|nr:glycosyltransferase [Siphonobacter sp. BAB-5385]OZI08576.1 glycosyl transferase family 1 [Siphonobacter sp. BAB-5385]